MDSRALEEADREAIAAEPASGTTLPDVSGLLTEPIAPDAAIWVSRFERDTVLGASEPETTEVDVECEWPLLDT